MSLEKVRLDKWLWSVRIFKSRTIATNACKSGKIKINGKASKPSSMISEGTKIEVHKNGFVFQFVALKLIQKRVGAPIAQACYEDITPAEELAKFENWYVGKAAPERRDRGTGRPTKKERREIERFKDFYFDDEDFS